MSEILKTFRGDVEAFLKTRQMAPTKFGKLFLNDVSFVRRLRDGLDVRTGTIEAVRAKMLAHDGEEPRKNAA